MERFEIYDNSVKHLLLDVKDQQADYEISVGANAKLTVAMLVDCQSDINFRLRMEKPGSSAIIAGLINGNKGAVNFHSWQHHLAQGTMSNLWVKSVISGNSQFDFEGTIRLEKTAQKTDAYQRSDSLLMSKTAHAQSRPILEILANDVRCTHGATIGRINEDEIWYIMTRGISRDKAEQLIISGYWNSALNLMPEAVKPEIADRISRWL